MFDVFISYGHQDQAWVRTLAENLYRAGLEVFYDEWEIGPGDVLVHRLDEGIRTSRNGILVVSPASLSCPWVMEEYAAMLTRTIAGQQRLIPVLLGEAELPQFLAARVWVDFRHADGPAYERRVSQMVAALRGERPPRPARDEPRSPPPGSGFRPERTQHMVLPRIFVSYSSHDRDFGTRLVQDLRFALGSEDAVWYDGGLQGGDAWWRKIVGEVMTRNTFIVVLSPDSMDSPWVNDEVDLAWRQKNSPAKMRIIPLLYRQCEVRGDLQNLQIIRFLSPTTYERAFAELLVALGLSTGSQV